MSGVNYFEHGMDAERYAQARPYIHRTAIDKFRSFAHIDAPLLRALDIGCGTGQSTIALTKTAELIIGVDSSMDMLTHTEPHPKIEYLQSKAEAIPLVDQQLDVITVAQAFHWFDHDAFLMESSRLLRPNGWLVVYTSWFTGEMKDDSSFSRWFNGEYLSRYPTPPRDRTEVTKILGPKHGIAIRGGEEFSDEIKMSNNRFTDYQLSTTNVIAAIKAGNESFEDAARWIKASIAKFFLDKPERTFLFWGKIWYLQRIAN